VVKLLTKEQKRSIGLFIIPFLGSLIIRLLYLTNKKKFHAPKSLGEDNVIMACWHGELLLIPYAYLHYRKTPNVKLFISEHFDGELIAKTLTFFGFGTIRGSTTRGGAKALIKAIKEVKGGSDIGITPDGPKGPRHEVQDGIIAIAQKTKKKVVLVEIKPSKFWQLKSWDKFVVPKPFGELHYYISEPIDLSDVEFEQARKILKEGLLKHDC